MLEGDADGEGVRPRPSIGGDGTELLNVSVQDEDLAAEEILASVMDAEGIKVDCSHPCSRED